MVGKSAETILELFFKSLFKLGALDLHIVEANKIFKVSKVIFKVT